MQMTMDQTIRPGLAHAFALRRGSGYVMRSEKRPAYGGSSPNRGGRKPKRPRAGILYILFTILISIIIWPVGLVMLWSRRVRMQAGTKLLISLLTLCVSVFLIVFALTVHVDNPRFTEFQDKANDWLNRAAADIAVAGDAAYKKTSETWGVMTEFADNALQPALNTLADGIDRGVALTGQARAFVESKLKPADAPTDAPPAESAEPGGETPAPEADSTITVNVPEGTPDPATAQALSGGMLTADGSFLPGETPEITPAPSASVPEPVAAPDDGEAPNSPEIPDDAGVEVKAMPVGTEAAEEPAELGPVSRVKPAGLATVHYNKVGKLYHMRPTCKSMTKSTAYTLGEAIADGKEPCKACGSPDPSVLKIEHVAWADADKVFHTSDECDSFKGKWKLIALEDAVAGGYTACAACGADLYAADILGPDAVPTPEPTEAPSPEPAEAADEVEPKAMPDADAAEETEENAEAERAEQPSEQPEAEADEAPGEESSETPEAEPTETPEAEPSETPEAGPSETPEAEPSETPEAEPSETPEAEPTPTPITPLKPAGDAIVYHSSNGKFYHRYSVCKAMSGSDPYKLSEITAKYQRCKTCNPPDTSLVDEPCLWMDADSICHTSDECENFNGDYTLIPVGDALEQGMTGCPYCGAEVYLVPDEVLGE